MDLSKPFEVNDFAGSESLLGSNEYFYCDLVDTPEAKVTYKSDGCPYELVVTPKGMLYMLIGTHNMLRELYLHTGNSAYRNQIETLLPRSYKERES